MCGRTASTLTKESISYATAYKDSSTGERQVCQWVKDSGDQSYEPNFNQTSGHCLPVLVSGKSLAAKSAEGNDSSGRLLCAMRWGLRPHWIQSNENSPINPINCRFETMAQKKMFSSALKNGRRCVVVVDGFFEWKTNPNKGKDPYFLYFPQEYINYKTGDYSWLKDQSKLIDDNEWRGPRLLTMAALFNRSPDGDLTFTVVTVPSHPSLEWLHDRMPAILDSDDSIRDWLDSDNVSADKAIKLLTPFGGLDFHMISRLVSNVINNSYENLLPIDVKPKQKTIDQWFVKKSSKNSIKKEIKEEEEDVTPAKKNKQ